MKFRGAVGVFLFALCAGCYESAGPPPVAPGPGVTPVPAGTSGPVSRPNPTGPPGQADGGGGGSCTAEAIPICTAQLVGVATTILLADCATETCTCSVFSVPPPDAGFAYAESCSSP